MVEPFGPEMKDQSRYASLFQDKGPPRRVSAAGSISVGPYLLIILQFVFVFRSSGKLIQQFATRYRFAVSCAAEFTLTFVCAAAIPETRMNRKLERKGLLRSDSMEDRRRGRPGIFLELGILMIVSSRVGFSASDSSSTSEVETLNQDGSAASYAFTVPCHEKWVVKSYFDEYRSLDDATFEHYRDAELTPCSFEMLPRDPRYAFKLSRLDRGLTGEGSHRSLFTRIRISIDEEFAAKSLFRSCEVILVERLPSGVFADPFELQHVRDRGVYDEVAVFGDTNLELPSFLSNRTLVEVHMFFSPDSLLEQKNGLEIKVEVPLHARYQPLDGSGYSVVQFGEPDVFARCSMEKRSSSQSHLFVLTSNGAISYKYPTVWKIPSGLETNAGFVSIVTFLSASLSALVIIVASVFHSNIKLHENVKIS